MLSNPSSFAKYHPNLAALPDISWIDSLSGRVHGPFFHQQKDQKLVSFEIEIENKVLRKCYLLVDCIIQSALTRLTEGNVKKSPKKVGKLGLNHLRIKK